MNMSVNFPNSKSKHLNPEQTAEFGRRVDEIRREVMDSLGNKMPSTFIKFEILCVIVK